MALPTIQSNDASELARKHTPRAIQVLADIIEMPELYETKDVIKASEALMDRAHGKPTQAVIVAQTERRKALQFASMSDADLLSVIEGEYTEVPAALALPNPDTDPLLG